MSENLRHFTIHQIKFINCIDVWQGDLFHKYRSLKGVYGRQPLLLTCTMQFSSYFIKLSSGFNKEKLSSDRIPQIMIDYV